MMTRRLSVLDIAIIIVLIIVAADSYLSFGTTHHSNCNNCSGYFIYRWYKAKSSWT